MPDEKDDNTNPDVPFDGAHPDNIPPADSNEQLAIAHEKREAAIKATAARRRKAAANRSDSGDGGHTETASDQPSRTGAPQGRTTKPTTKA